MLLSSHWTVGQVPWQQYLQALVDPQSQLVALVSIQSPWVCRAQMMKCLFTDQVTTCLMCGPDMADTHPLHLWDNEQGKLIIIIFIKPWEIFVVWFSSFMLLELTLQCWVVVKQRATSISWDVLITSCLPDLISLFFIYHSVVNSHFSHTDSASTSNQKTSSAEDLMRGTEVAPPPSSSSYNQVSSFPSWLSNITSSTFGKKQPKGMQTASSGGNSLISKFKWVNEPDCGLKPQDCKLCTLCPSQIFLSLWTFFQHLVVVWIPWEWLTSCRLIVKVCKWY